MTTIAYKSGFMACDSAWTNDHGVATLLTKMFRLSSGAVVGESGDSDSRHVRALIDKVKSADKLPMAKDLADLKIHYSALIAFPNGELAQIDIWHCEDAKEWRAGAYKVNRGYAAVGSGGDLAIGFMGAKRSAKEAVEFACTWDNYSRPPVHVMQVRQPRKKTTTAKRRTK